MKTTNFNMTQAEKFIKLIMQGYFRDKKIEAFGAAIVKKKVIHSPEKN